MFVGKILVMRAERQGSNQSAVSVLGMELPCGFVASGLRTLLRFARFCRRMLSIFIAFSASSGTHNLLVPGSNPGGPTKPHTFDKFSLHSRLWVTTG